MKKNKMLRTASAMLILTIITISIIGGALAKYVTEASGTDTARVAKFGVTATVQGNLFGSTYAKATETDANTIITYNTNGGSVSAAARTDQVIAPGTKNTEGMKLSVKGTPEVSTMVTLENVKNEAGTAEYADSDIYLAAGDYGVMVEYTGEVNADNIGNFYSLVGDTYSTATTVPTDDSKVYELQQVAKVDADYYPLTWYVDGVSVANQAAAKESLVTKYNEKTFTPNSPINLGSSTIGWAWNFQNGDDATAKAANDLKDTILGNMIAAQTDSTIAVVKKSGDTYVTVEYRTEPVKKTGPDNVEIVSANQVVNAYANDVKVACLTAAFNVSLKVEQID